jgi:carbon monoxide dehydrogenase subunit G
MPDTSRTFSVAKDPQVVLDYLKDFSRAQEWDPGTVSCQRIEHSEGSPVEVGSTWRNVSRFAGRETELRYRLDRMEPGRLTFVGANKTATSVDDIVLTAQAGGTQIAYTSRITFNGPAKLVGPFLRPVLKRLGDKTQESLIRVINQL